ncbi:DUF7665 family protein [Cupriavidus sp. 30B13]|uniref:DUF7665 family protein n=1 Tax=Cupriavidus sp. 30B13 TaxID=3384241 RepID=UPI003B91679F
MSTATDTLSPDHRAFSVSIEQPVFRMGVADGRWNLIRVEWPIALIEVSASVGTFVLRFELSGYPAQPPTAQLWDVNANMRLTDAHWPRSKGGRVGEVFRLDWNAGTALYLPCDRVTIATHPGWIAQMPAKLWRPDGSIVQYIEAVYELLHSADFTSPLVAAA